MSKRVQISPDSGSSWYTFPGDKADITDTGSAIKDTIFGQDFESDQTGMINFAVSCNGVYKGFAGYVAKLMKSGTPTTFTAEATTLVSGKIYKITDVSKNIWDRTTTVVVNDSGTPIAGSNILSIDYLHGIVTLQSAYSVLGAITFTGKYLPMTQVAGANSFTLTQNASAIDNTDYVAAQANGGYRTYIYGLKTVKLAIKGIYSSSNAFRALLAARSELIIEINPDGSEKSVARGWFKPMTIGQSGNVGALEDQSLDFGLAVPDQSDVITPFSWQFDATTTLSRALREAILSWQSNTVTLINYLPDGVNGVKGAAVITDLSLTGGLDVMNDFTLKFQGSSAPIAYP